LKIFSIFENSLKFLVQYIGKNHKFTNFEGLKLFLEYLACSFWLAPQGKVKINAYESTEHHFDQEGISVQGFF